MEKVKLPHDVAQAIEQLRGMDFEVDNRSIITAFCNNDYDGYPALVKYAGTNFNDLLKALVNGYEVELSKEDKVREVIQSYCGGTMVSQWVLDDIRMIYEGGDHE